MKIDDAPATIDCIIAFSKREKLFSNGKLQNVLKSVKVGKSNNDMQAAVQILFENLIL
jgi:hypothetical protein